MTSIRPVSSCCCNTEPVQDRLFRILEKVSAAALGVFSAYASFEMFVPFFLLGIAIGFDQSFYTEDNERTASQRTVSCSQGLLEQLTGAKLPPLVSLISNLAITWCHIDHHTSVFVPVIGVGLGAWIGQNTPRLAYAK